MSVVRIRESQYYRVYRGFFKRKYMRILSGHWKLSVLERCPYREVRLPSKRKNKIFKTVVIQMRETSQMYQDFCTSQENYCSRAFYCLAEKK